MSSSRRSLPLADIPDGVLWFITTAYLAASDTPRIARVNKSFYTLTTAIQSRMVDLKPRLHLENEDIHRLVTAIDGRRNRTILVFDYGHMNQLCNHIDHYDRRIQQIRRIPYFLQNSLTPDQLEENLFSKAIDSKLPFQVCAALRIVRGPQGLEGQGLFHAGLRGWVDALPATNSRNTLCQVLLLSLFLLMAFYVYLVIWHWRIASIYVSRNVDEIVCQEVFDYQQRGTSTLCDVPFMGSWNWSVYP